MLRKDGVSFPGEVHAKVISFDNEPGIQVWIRDLTEQKLLEKRLIEAQKMEALGTLTGGIAHDFNNLLTIINGYAEIILSGKAEDDPGYADLETILKTGRKGADLVQKLLAFSKKDEGNPQLLDLNRVVASSVSLIERIFPKMIQIETIFDKDLRPVYADASQMEQVLVNLCINAKEAMPEGGRLRIETRNTFVDEEYCRLRLGAKSGPHVLVEVTDTGVGMNKETRDRIFEPFFTTKGWDFKKGTGLGLSVARGVIEQHGGWITCESEQGKGTVFRIYFQAAVDAFAEQPVAVAESVSGPETILLVDDEQYVRELGKRILERAGFTVITASNGGEALDIYAREKTSIGLVVLDLIMPQMDGGKCLEELVTINPRVKIVVSSGHSLDSRERDHLGSYAKGFVDKPYQMGQFLEVVRRALATE